MSRKPIDCRPDVSLSRAASNHDATHDTHFLVHTTLTDFTIYNTSLNILSTSNGINPDL